MTYIASKCKKIYLACERLTHLDIAVGHLCCVRGGHSDFRFCGFGYFFGSVFRFFVPKNFSFSVLVCIAVCGFSVFPKVGGKGGYGYT